jgi:galactokinase
MNDLKKYIDSNFEVFVRAPGRINLIGEHTDYNLGFVMPAAIDKYIYFGFKANGTNTIRLEAKNYDQSFSIDLRDIKPTKLHWANYLLGVVDQFLKRGHLISGFDVQVYGTIPIGSGLSSSAAIECGMAKGISTLFDLNLSKWDLVSIGNQTEHDFLGVKSGILDQFASVFGKADHAMMMDCRSRDFDYVPLHLGDYGFVVINSMVKHTHTTSGYLDRVKECSRAVHFFNEKYGDIKSLRDVSSKMLEDSKTELNPLDLNRTTFIVSENQRVLDFKKAFETSDFQRVGQLLNDCHGGLSEQYEVSCKELDLLASFAQRHPECLGARMMGGGFGGCTLNLIHRDQQVDFIAYMKDLYRKETSIDPEVYLLNVVDGVSQIQY